MKQGEVYCPIYKGIVNPDNSTIYHMHSKPPVTKQMKTAEEWAKETGTCDTSSELVRQHFPNNKPTLTTEKELYKRGGNYELD